MEVSIMIVHLFTIVHLFICITVTEGASLDCNFDEDFCGWTQDDSNDVDWEIYPNEKYISVLSSQSNKTETSRLVSPVQAPGQYCLTIWYRFYGEEISTFNVYIMKGKVKTVIFHIGETTGQSLWLKSVLGIESNHTFQIVLEVNFQESSYDSLDIDGISLKSGHCIDCDFDVDFCKWNQYDGDNFDWTRHRGNTNTTDTGPSADHTTGDGYYIYIETSNKNGHDKAAIYSPTVNAGKYCVSFWYYMYGEGIDRLRLLLWYTNGSAFTLSSLLSAQGQKWKLQNIFVSTREIFRISFEGRVKDAWNYYAGDIAIDDVELLSCQDCSDPTPNYGRANSTNYTFGAAVEIKCYHGYILKGDDVIVCGQMERWNGTATCIPHDCGILDIQNGTFITTNGTTFGQVGRQECDNGFVLIGEENVRCTLSGWFNASAYCKMIDAVSLESDTNPLVVAYVLIPVIVLIFAIVVTVVYMRKKHPRCIKIFKTDKKSRNVPTGDSRNRQTHFNQTYNNEVEQIDDEYATIAERGNNNKGLDTVCYAVINKKSSKHSSERHSEGRDKTSGEGHRIGLSKYDVPGNGHMNIPSGSNKEHDSVYDNAFTGKMKTHALSHDDYSHLGDVDPNYQHPFNLDMQTVVQDTADYAHLDGVKSNRKSDTLQPKNGSIVKDTKIPDMQSTKVTNSLLEESDYYNVGTDVEDTDKNG